METDDEDADRSKFLEALASAITSWQLIEVGLHQIYLALIFAWNEESASAAFNSVVNFNARLAMTHSAAQFSLKGSRQLSKWNNFNNRIGKRAKRRNELVHYTFGHDLTKKPPQWVLIPTVYDPSTNFRENYESNPKYDLARIKETGDSFEDLGEELLKFAKRVSRAMSKSQKKLLESETRRHLARHMKGAQKPKAH